MKPGTFPYTGPIVPADAAAVVLTIEDGRYLVQLRDDKPGIFYPGHFGLFGGAVERDETFEEAAVRELNEELALSVSGRLRFLTEIVLGFEPFHYESVKRVFFAATIMSEELADIRVSEGQRYDLMDARRLLTRERMVPYDAFAIWLHCNSGVSDPAAAIAED